MTDRDDEPESPRPSPCGPPPPEPGGFPAWLVNVLAAVVLAGLALLSLVAWG